MKKKLLIAFFVLFFTIKPAIAQQVPSLAINVEIADTSVVEGDIISYSDNGLKKADKPYDILTLGVVVASPVISTGLKSDKTKAVVTGGIAKVKVKGPIKAGDFIASSSEAGVGQKSNEAGYVLGKAIGNLDTNNSELVSVEISPSYFSNNNQGSVGFFGIAKDNLRFFIAAVVGILTLIFTTFAFVRLVTTGVSAIGRNPLARRTILTSMIISGGVVLLIAAAGVGAVIGIITLGG